MDNLKSIKDLNETELLSLDNRISSDVVADNGYAACKVNKELIADSANNEETPEADFEDIVKNIIKEINLLCKLKGISNIVDYEDHMVTERKRLPSQTIPLQIDPKAERIIDKELSVQENDKNDIANTVRLFTSFSRTEYKGKKPEELERSNVEIDPVVSVNQKNQLNEKNEKSGKNENKSLGFNIKRMIIIVACCITIFLCINVTHLLINLNGSFLAGNLDVNETTSLSLVVGVSMNETTSPTVPAMTNTIETAPTKSIAAESAILEANATAPATTQHIATTTQTQKQRKKPATVFANPSPLKTETRQQQYSSSIWNSSGTTYSKYSIVTYQEKLYVCIEKHISASNLIPSVAVAYWRPVQIWMANGIYNVNDVVIYNNAIYICITKHTSSEAWKPSVALAFWKMF